MNAIIQALLAHLQRNPPAAPAPAPSSTPQIPPLDPNMFAQAISPPEPSQMPSVPQQASNPLVQAMTGGGGMLDLIKRLAANRQSSVDQAANY